jgi:hypothetical protein
MMFRSTVPPSLSPAFDVIDVNSDRQMTRIAAGVNAGRRCS